MAKFRVLFLCTGNSCRSQMAEAIINFRFADKWEAFSAGTRPAGFVHPKALEALAETGILHTGRSKHLEEFRDQDFDLVVTVCDPDAQECPAWLGKGKRLQHAYADPALTNELNDFRKICKAMESEIPTILFEYEMEMK